MATQIVHFSVDGEFLVNHFRDRCLEGCWVEALESLKISLPDASLDHHISFLDGTKTLKGIDEFDYVDEDSKTTKEYLNQLNEIYGINFSFAGKVWKPVLSIEDPSFSSFGTGEVSSILSNLELLPVFRLFFGEILVNTDNDIKFFSREGSPFVHCFQSNTQSVPFWIIRPRDQIENILKEIEDDGHLDIMTHPGLDWAGTERFESYGDKSWKFKNRGLYSWGINFPRLQDLRVNKEEDYTKTWDLPWNSASGTLVYPDIKEETPEETPVYFISQEEPPKDRTEKLAELREQIIEQAEKGDGFQKFKDPLGNVWMVPKGPFYNWVFKRDQERIKKFLDHYWEEVSCSGWKMGGDSPIHTDWWVGAGIPLDHYQYVDDPVNSYFYGVKHDLEFRDGLDLDVICGTGLLHDSTIFVANHGIPEEFPEKSVLVIPEMSQEYLEASINCCENGGAVIAKKGGPGSHLATVSPELGIRLAIDLKDTPFKTGDTCRMDLGAGTLSHYNEIRDLENCGFMSRYKKASNLGKVISKGFSVPKGFLCDSGVSMVSGNFEDLNLPVIIRSCGKPEDGEHSFAGIFDSVVVESWDEFNSAFEKVRDSFTSPIAKVYMKKTGKDCSPGYIVQEYLHNPKLSAVITKGEIEITAGSCDSIVQGRSKKARLTKKRKDELTRMYDDIRYILKAESLIIEATFTDKWYVLQAREIKI